MNTAEKLGIAGVVGTIVGIATALYFGLRAGAVKAGTSSVRFIQEIAVPVGVSGMGYSGKIVKFTLKAGLKTAPYDYFATLGYDAVTRVLRADTGFIDGEIPPGGYMFDSYMEPVPGSPVLVLSSGNYVVKDGTPTTISVTARIGTP